MAKGKKNKDIQVSSINENVFIAGAGEVVEQKISTTLEVNYMPYAMSIIVSRAIPQIDGFKPSHRKLLYTMYKAGLLNSDRKKSATVCGTTMQLNPHGEQAIYDTMVRLSEGYRALLHPFVDSKGNFGKHYSRDMQCAASRYTEVKLSDISSQLFADIDKETVDFVDNYDATMKEPTLLPVTFPSILVNANSGIAVSMASSICSFNLNEICDTTIALISNPEHDLSETLLAPDLSGGAYLLYNKEDIENIYNTGRGSFKLRSKYTYDKKNNCIDILEIPNTTTIEAIIEKVIDLVKQKKVTEISDIRDETGLNGLKITIDLKRGIDPDRLMQKLFKATPLEDSFSCNFNVLVNGIGMPQVLGVRSILNEWISFRTQCIRRRVVYSLNKAQDKLHLLQGLSKILLNIDKAIDIIRKTEEEAEVVPNLMIGFSIDNIQANYVAEIKLRNINKEYILKRVAETASLEQEIKDMQFILEHESRLHSIIVDELKEVKAKYGSPRRSEILYFDETEIIEFEDELPDYGVTIFLTEHGYFKKITQASLRMSGEQKTKEDDTVIQIIETSNKKEILFFTNKQCVYKAYINDFDDSKASVLGEYLPSKLDMDEGENIIFMAVTDDYLGLLIMFFENGKVAKVPLLSYQTKFRRKKLIKAYSDKSPLVSMFYIIEDEKFIMQSSSRRLLICDTSLILSKISKDTQGIYVMTQKKGHTVTKIYKYGEDMLDNTNRYITSSYPAAGSLPEKNDKNQLTFM